MWVGGKVSGGGALSMPCPGEHRMRRVAVWLKKKNIVSKRRWNVKQKRGVATAVVTCAACTKHSQC